MHLPAPSQSKHLVPGNSQIRAVCPWTGLGCCRRALPVQTARGHFINLCCFWCFFTALKQGWMAEPQQKASEGCPGLLPRQQQDELQGAPAHRAARRGTGVCTTGKHLGGSFSQGLQPGCFLQSLFYYQGHSPQTSSSPTHKVTPFLHGHHPQWSTYTHRTPPTPHP